MAYKEFRNEKLYDAPEIETTGLKQGLGAITDAAVARKSIAAKKENDKLAKKEAYKIDVKEAKFTEDAREAADVVTKEVLPQAYRDIETSGSTGISTRKLEVKAHTIVDESNAQYQHFQDLQKRVDGKKAVDPYYMADKDADIVFNAAYGNDSEKVNYSNRTPRLQKAEKELFRLQSFNQPKLIADYVAQEPDENYGKDTSNENQAGVTNTKSKIYKGKFLVPDGAGGATIKVTDADVDEYFKFDADNRVEKFYTAQAEADIDKQIENDKNLDPAIAALTDPEAKRGAYIKAKAIPLGKIAREKAKADLYDKAYVNTLTKTGLSINHTQAQKVEDEKVKATSVVAPLVVNYTKKDGTAVTHHIPVIGESFMKGKAGDAKPLTIGGVSLFGAKQLNSDPGDKDNLIKNNNFVDAQILGAGYMVSIDGKDVGSDRQFQSAEEALNYSLGILKKLSPEDRKKAQVRRVVYGKSIDKVVTKGDGDNSERKMVDTGRVDSDFNPIYEYEKQYTTKEIPFMMDANEQIEKAIGKATNNQYNAYDIKKRTAEEKALLAETQKLGIEVRDSKGVKGGNKNQHTEPAKRTEAAKEKQKETKKIQAGLR